MMNGNHNGTSVGQGINSNTVMTSSPTRQASMDSITSQSKPQNVNRSVLPGHVIRSYSSNDCRAGSSFTPGLRDISESSDNVCNSSSNNRNNHRLQAAESFAGCSPPLNEIRSRKKSELRVLKHSSEQVELSPLNRNVSSYSADHSHDFGAADESSSTATARHGHQFISANLRSPTWCDKCGDFIWGVYKQCLICTNCHFTCHYTCHPLVTLDCSGFASRPNYDGVVHTETSFTADVCKGDGGSGATNAVFHRSPSKRRWIFDSLKAHALFYSGATGTTEESENDSGYHTGPGYRTVLPRRPPGERTLTRDDLRRRISKFNSNNHGLLMDAPVDESDIFQGFVRVHMNLIRPINMCISVEPPTLFDVCSSDSSTQCRNKDTQLTSFYLPKDTTKVIHLSSRTTTDEVIKILLSKFYITDNPRKFALYEKIENSGKTVSRRLADDELPLQICLSWTSDGLEQLDRNQFVLQDNDTGEILWEAFSLPELENFLVVLNREEEEYVSQLKAKYRLLKIQMTKRLQKLEPRKETTAGGGDKRTPVFV